MDYDLSLLLPVLVGASIVWVLSGAIIKVIELKPTGVEADKVMNALRQVTLRNKAKTIEIEKEINES